MRNLFTAINIMLMLIHIFDVTVMRPLKEWTVDEVNAFLTSRSLQRYRKTFQHRKVNGRKLTFCSEVRHLQQLGVDIEVDAIELLDEIKKSKGNMSNNTIIWFYDTVDNMVL